MIHGFSPLCKVEFELFAACLQDNDWQTWLGQSRLRSASKSLVATGKAVPDLTGLCFFTNQTKSVKDSGAPMTKTEAAPLLFPSRRKKNCLCFD